MPAERQIYPQQPRAGDYQEYMFSHCTGLVFNRFRSDEWIDPETKTHRYRDGVFWTHDHQRTMLLDNDGKILKALNARSLEHRANTNEVYDIAGLNAARPYNLIDPGGMIGLDSDNNIYLADETMHRVARYALPHNLRTTPRGLAVPPSNGGLFGGEREDNYDRPNSISPVNVNLDRIGAIAFGNQLIVRDHRRIMVWNDYLKKPSGAPADLFIEQENGWSDAGGKWAITGQTRHTIDHRQRLWSKNAFGRLVVYQLPLTQNSEPLAGHIPLYWADAQETEVEYACEHPLAFETATQSLWIFDLPRYRLLRVRIPDDLPAKLLVDAVIGQKNKTDGLQNRGLPAPDAASFGDACDMKFDHRGNLFVVDNAAELHANGRIIAFLAEDLQAIRTMFPAIQAKRVYVASTFTEHVGQRKLPNVQSPNSPVAIAFNSRNEMVVGNDGYFHDPQTRNVNQLYLYRAPLDKPTPDAVIELPLGTPGELAFDEQDNLIAQDCTYNKVWVINFDKDPIWLRPLP